MKLLSLSNPKVQKGESRGYLTAILHLAPYAVAGINVCPMAELAGCWRGCLSTAGHGGISKGGRTFAPYGVTVPDNAVQAARIRKTRLWAEDKGAFMTALHADILRAKRLAKKHRMKLAIRLNGTSDIAWENAPMGAHANVFAAFPEVTFYDYTKLHTRNVSHIPNYSLTASYSEASPVFAASVQRKAAHLNWAVVFDTPRNGALPATFKGRPVIDGDLSDLRFTDPTGVIVGLRAKGAARKDESGFVIRGAA